MESRRDVESHPLYIFVWGIIVGLTMMVVVMGWPVH